MRTTDEAAMARGSSRNAVMAVFVLVAALMFWLASGTAHAAPPVGTVIGNQATATYNDAGGAPRTATSNLVQTTVSQVKSFTLDAPGFRTASPGQPVYYPHTITNTGNGTDTYTLNAPTTGGAFAHTGLVYYIDADNNGVPDNFTPITTTGPLAMGGVFRFVVAGTVPGTATAPQQGTITVSVTDTSGGPALTNLDTTTVATSAVTVTKSLSQTSGPSPNAGPITVTLSFTNTGSVAASALELHDALPVGMNYIAGSGRWSTTGATVLTDAVDGAQGTGPTITYDYNGGTRTVNALISSLPAGNSGTVTFQVSIGSGIAPGFLNNTATYQTSTQTPLVNTNTAAYQVLQVASVVANGSTTSSVNGTAEPVTVASAAAGSTITFTNVIWNTGNAADTFMISMAGQGSWPVGSTFTLLQSDGVTSLIANTTPSIPVYAAGCAAGFETDTTNQRCGYRVILRVQLPVGATGGPYSITKTATSTFDNTKTDTVIDTLTLVAANTVDVTNNTARADITTNPGTANAGNAATTGFGATGTTVITTNAVTPSTSGPTTTRFQLYVNNTGAINDSFNLTSSAAPAGWTVTFRADGGAGNCSTVGAALTTTGTINASSARLICAEVVVPVANSGNAAPGNYDIDFTATSALNGTVSDVKRDRVTVGAVHSVTVTPNNTQQTFPGGAVTYTHVVTNLGNAAEPITYAAGFLTDSRSGQGWTSIAYVDGNSNGTFDPGVDDVAANQISTATTFNVAVGGTRTVFVRVFAPGSAVGTDPANVTTLTATYNTGASTATATDSTSVTDGLTLLKEQGLPTSCAALGTPTYSTAPIPAGPATAPGQCIAYRITGTNTTAAGITAVFINDNIPGNTRQNNGCGAPATTVGTITSPGNGNTGLVSANVGSLAASTSVVVTFCVRIDP